jgi:hypothetical protein
MEARGKILILMNHDIAEVLGEQASGDRCRALDKTTNENLKYSYWQVGHK